PDAQSTVSWSFGDGGNGSGAQASHTYTDTGAFAVVVAVRDSSGAVNTIQRNVSITITALQVDPADARKTALAVGGTVAGDTIFIDKFDSSGRVRVWLNSTGLGVFAPTGRLLVYGQAGDDNIEVAGSVIQPAWLFGDAGNDTLKGGAGNDVLL